MQLRPGIKVSGSELDGVVISGGHDIEPVLYSRPTEVEGNYDPERDAFESEVIELALQKSVPLLGICRGAQLINVKRGGNLFQNLRKRYAGVRRRRSLFPIAEVTLERDSRLSGIAGSTQLRVNRLHNQSIDVTGRDLRISAHDINGIVQAIESNDDAFVFGVQWHPEFLLYQSASRRLFRALANAAAARQ